MQQLLKFETRILLVSEYSYFDSINLSFANHIHFFLFEGMFGIHQGSV